MLLRVKTNKTKNEIRKITGYYGVSLTPVVFENDPGNVNVNIKIPDLENLQQITVLIDGTIDPIVFANTICDCKLIDTYNKDFTSVSPIDYLQIIYSHVNKTIGYYNEADAPVFVDVPEDTRIILLDIDKEAQVEVLVTVDSDNGSIMPSGSVFVPYGSDLLFTIVPDAGYEVDELRLDGNLVSPIIT